MSTVMATAGSPICTFVYLMSLIGSNNNLVTSFHAMYSIATILPVFVLAFRWQMQDGRLFERRSLQQRKMHWMLVLRKYWVRILGTCSAFFLYDFVNLYVQPAQPHGIDHC